MGITINAGRSEIISLLLEHYAAPSAKDRRGIRPLHLAAQKGHTKAVIMLMNHGASPLCQDQLGRTALHHAAGNGHSSTVRALLEQETVTFAGDSQPERSLVDSVDHRGASALHLAVEGGHNAVVETLLAAGSDAMLPNLHGRTPRDLAALGRAQRPRLYSIFQSLSQSDADAPKASGVQNGRPSSARGDGRVQAMIMLPRQRRPTPTYAESSKLHFQVAGASRYLHRTLNPRGVHVTAVCKPLGRRTTLLSSILR